MVIFELLCFEFFYLPNFCAPMTPLVSLTGRDQSPAAQYSKNKTCLLVIRSVMYIETCRVYPVCFCFASILLWAHFYSWRHLKGHVYFAGTHSSRVHICVVLVDQFILTLGGREVGSGVEWTFYVRQLLKSGNSALKFEEVGSPILDNISVLKTLFDLYQGDLYGSILFCNCLNTVHPNIGFLLLPDSMNVWCSNGHVMWLGGPFEYWTFWTINKQISE